MTVKQVHLMSAFLHFVFLLTKKKKNLFHATYKRITVRRFETNRANSSDVTTVSLCMSGVQRNKDMIACGRCPAPLPLQKPRDITASCIDVSLSLTCE